MEKQELTLIDPKEFGLEEKKVSSIEASFLPKKVEADGFVQVYEQILTKEINKDTCKEARELRLKLVKVRTGISDVHKTEKAFYLASGKYVDALKNKLTLPITQMEEKLTEIEKYFENQEKERLQKLRSERESKLGQFGTDTTFIALDLMTDDQFQDLFEKEKLAFDTRKKQEEEAERLALENERLDKLSTERRIECATFINFIPADFDFRNSSNDDYKETVLKAKELKLADEKEREEQRKELERIKAEQEEKERKEREEQVRKDELFQERYETLKQYKPDAGLLKLADLTEDQFDELLETEQKAHEYRQQKEKELANLKAEQERLAKAEQERQEQERKKSLAPDVDKLRDVYARLKDFDYPEVSSKEAKSALDNLQQGIKVLLVTLADDAKKLK